MKGNGGPANDHSDEEWQVLPKQDFEMQVHLYFFDPQGDYDEEGGGKEENKQEIETLDEI